MTTQQEVSQDGTVLTVVIDEEERAKMSPEERAINDAELNQLIDQLKTLGHRLRTEDAQAFYARGRVPDCDCGLIQCECEEIRKHKKGCRYYRALLAPIAFACEPHGRDVCPECDPCTCSTLP